jgi:hypothetical protein
LYAFFILPMILSKVYKYEASHHANLSNLLLLHLTCVKNIVTTQFSDTPYTMSIFVL